MDPSESPCTHIEPLNWCLPSEFQWGLYLFIFSLAERACFQSHTAHKYNTSGLIQFTDDEIVFVGLNYRVGPFGFLASKKLGDNGDLCA